MSTTGADTLPQAFFLPVEHGQRFCLYHAPAGRTPKGRLIYLHPFAEEMNASRRVVAQQCRTLAANGFAVLQIDLMGCGESSHDFVDVTWDAWLDDVQQAQDWMDHHLPPETSGPLWLWGLRAGALLACAAACQQVHARPIDAVHLLLWQPVASGHQQLQQFMRLHAAAQWLGGAATGEAPPLALAAGRPAQVAGYSLSPKLANSLESATLELPDTSTGRVALFELVNTPAPLTQASPWSQRQAARWRDAGWLVQTQTVAAAPFWQNVADTVLDEALCQATVTALQNAGEPRA